MKWQHTLVFLPGEFHGQRSLWTTVHGVTKSNWACTPQLSDWACTPPINTYINICIKIYFYRQLHRSTHICIYIKHTHICTYEEELNSLLMKVKEESEKVGLKLNIQKTKIMEFGPITSWEIDRETGNSGWLYFRGLQNHCRWWLQPRN